MKITVLKAFETSLLKRLRVYFINFSLLSSGNMQMNYFKGRLSYNTYQAKYIF